MRGDSIMAICSNCGKKIKDDSVFCPFCGEKASVDTSVIESERIKKSEKSFTVEKKISKKTLIRMIIVGTVLVLITAIAVCEAKISNAKRLYAQKEFVKAASEIDSIPSLGREELIRIKTARTAGFYYESYLITKRIRLSDTSSIFKDAYQDAFWELMFGLYSDIRSIKSDYYNEIQKDEFQKFINIIYSELSSEFSMTKEEADELVSVFNQLETTDEQEEAANAWLDANFF